MDGYGPNSVIAFVGLKALSYLALAVLALALGYSAWAMLRYWPSINV